MSLIEPSPKQKKVQLRVNLDEEVLQEIKRYCQWAGLSRIEEFLEESAAYVFKKDREWKKYNKKLNKGKSQNKAKLGDHDIVAENEILEGLDAAGVSSEKIDESLTKVEDIIAGRADDFGEGLSSKDQDSKEKISDKNLFNKRFLDKDIFSQKD